MRRWMKRLVAGAAGRGGERRAGGGHGHRHHDHGGSGAHRARGRRRPDHGRSVGARLPGSALRRAEAELHPEAPSRADLLVVVGRELEIGWLPPLLQQSRNAKIQPGADGYLDASLTVRDPRDPHGPDHARHGGRPPAGQSALLARSRQRAPDRPGHCAAAGEAGPVRRGVLRQPLRRLRSASRRGREALGRPDGAAQGLEDRHVSPVLAELHGPLRPERPRLRRAEARHPAVALAHAPAHRGDEASRASGSSASSPTST